MDSPAIPLMEKKGGSCTSKSKSYINNDEAGSIEEGKSTPTASSSRRTTAISKIIDKAAEVREIAAQNIDALLRREANLDELEQKTRDMENGSQQFKENTRLVADHYEKKDKSLKKILTLVTCILVIIMVVFILVIIYA